MPKQPPEAGRSAVLALLKREGPICADALAKHLHVTAMAVRQHLYALKEDGLADYVEEVKGRGRPVKQWSATTKADAQFADAHSALAVDLIKQMQVAFGQRGVDRLLRLRTGEQEELYRKQVDGKRSLKARLEALAAIREREGYMAEVRRDSQSGAWLLVENHCPVCAAARVCTGLCREEISLFQRVLGDDVRVERLTHILAGAGRCTYRISEA